MPARMAGRLVVLVTAAVLALTACTDQPEPEPEPALYGPIPEDVCERLGLEDIAARFDLAPAGWWDDGVTLTRPSQVPTPDWHTDGDFDLARLDVAHLVRHSNLTLNISAAAFAPGPERDEAFHIMHDLVATLIDETAAHLHASE